MYDGMPPQAQAGAPVGTSPDGLGAILLEPGMQTQAPHQPTTHYYPRPQAGFPEPDDTSMQAALQSAGYTALLVAVTTGVGFAWGKGWGAAAGLTIGAGAANAYRAQKYMNAPDPNIRHEAVVSATVGVSELAASIYFLYRGAQTRKG